MLLLLLCLVPLLSACGWVKAHIGHAVPVEHAVGDSTTTLGGDTVHVYAAERFVVFGPTATAVSACVAQVSRAVREFRRYLDDEPPPFALVVAGAPLALTAADSLRFRQQRRHVALYVRPRDLGRVEGLDPTLPREATWPVAGPVARALLGAWVRERRGQPPAIETAVLQTGRALPPFPAWYVDAIAALLADPGAPDRAVDQLHDRASEMPSIVDLLQARDTSGAAPVPRDPRRLAGITGTALLVFVTEREGAREVRDIADALRAGRPALDALHDAKRLPRDPAQLEREFRAWLRDERAR